MLDVIYKDITKRMVSEDLKKSYYGSCYEKEMLPCQFISAS